MEFPFAFDPLWSFPMILLYIIIIGWVAITIASIFLSRDVEMHPEQRDSEAAARIRSDEGIEEDDDSLVDRDRTWARIVAISTAVLMFASPILLGYGMQFWFLICVGWAVGIYLPFSNFRYLDLYCPQLFAVVTEDGWRNELIPYGAGHHKRKWYEKIERASFFSLKPRLVSFTETYQASDGEVTVEPFFQFRIPLSSILIFFRFGINEVIIGIGAIIKVALTQQLIGETSQEIIKGDVLGEYFDKQFTDLPSPMRTLLEEHARRSNALRFLYEDFDADDPDNSTGPVSIREAIEIIYGILFMNLGIMDVEESAEVREARGVLSESELIDEATAKSLGFDSAQEARQAIKDGTLSRDVWRKAEEARLALSGDIKLNVNVLRIEGIDEETAKALATGIEVFKANKGGKS